MIMWSLVPRKKSGEKGRELFGNHTLLGYGWNTEAYATVFLVFALLTMFFHIQFYYATYHEPSDFLQAIGPIQMHTATVWVVVNILMHYDTHWFILQNVVKYNPVIPVGAIYVSDKLYMLCPSIVP